MFFRNGKFIEARHVLPLSRESQRPAPGAPSNELPFSNIQRVEFDSCQRRRDYVSLKWDLLWRQCVARASHASEPMNFKGRLSLAVFATLQATRTDWGGRRKIRVVLPPGVRAVLGCDKGAS